MDSNSEMIGELDALSEYLNRHTTNILKAFDSLEKDIPLASQSRKKIFIEKTTAVLRNLNLIDQVVTKSLRVDECDKIARLETLAGILESKVVDVSVSNNVDMEEIEQWTTNLKSEISDIKEQSQLDLCVDEKYLQQIWEIIGDNYALKSSICDPADYTLEIALKGQNWNIQVKSESTKPFMKSKTALIRFEVKRRSSSEIFSLRGLISSGKEVLFGPNDVSFLIKAVHNEKIFVRVKVFEKDIKQSPVQVDHGTQSLNVCKDDQFQFFSKAVNSQHEKQALRAKISFSAFFEQKAFSGVLKRPFAYLPKFQTVLIGEPDENKVGIYNAKTLNFLSWAINPDITKGTTFQTPNLIKVLKNGNIIILEEHQINILNENFAPVQTPIPGKYIGLAEGDNGSIVVETNMETSAAKMKLVLNADQYILSIDK